MTDRSLPILYSFRRCPYAIRARMALRVAEIAIEHREISLKNKPPEMIDASPKGTVPVLLLPDGTVLDESLEIIFWALSQNDPHHWLDTDPLTLEKALHLIKINDSDFKYHLDRYKYSVRYPQYTRNEYRHHGECFLKQLECLLQNRTYLLGNQPSLADIAVLPFIRQFALVDMAWFEQAGYGKLVIWLNTLLDSVWFTDVMQKQTPWTSGNGHRDLSPPNPVLQGTLRDTY